MAKYYSSHEEINKDFIQKGINTSKQGFHYSKEFMDAEKLDGDILKNYARFVDTMQHQDEYIKKAEKEIQFISEVILKEYSKKARHGACIDLSLFLSRVLELEGYWNYIVKGALKIQFERTLNIPDKYFWPVDRGDFGAAHAWIYAEPFTVIDLSIKYQNYDLKTVKYLPDYILEQSAQQYSATVGDIFSPEAILYYRQMGVNEAQIISRHDSGLTRFMKTFEARKISKDKVTFFYIPVAITASDDGNLGTFNNLEINGMKPLAFYNKIIKPSLNQYRSLY